MHVFELWEEVGAPSGNLQSHRENMQIALRKTSADQQDVAQNLWVSQQAQHSCAFPLHRAIILLYNARVGQVWSLSDSFSLYMSFSYISYN